PHYAALRCWSLLARMLSRIWAAIASMNRGGTVFPIRAHASENSPVKTKSSGKLASRFISLIVGRRNSVGCNSPAMLSDSPWLLQIVGAGFDHDRRSRLKNFPSGFWPGARFCAALATAYDGFIQVGARSSGELTNPAQASRTVMSFGMPGGCDGNTPRSL